MKSWMPASAECERWSPLPARAVSRWRSGARSA